MKNKFFSLMLLTFCFVFNFSLVQATTVCTQDNDKDRYYPKDTNGDGVEDDCDTLPFAGKGFEPYACDGGSDGMIDCTTDPGNTVCTEGTIDGKKLHKGAIEIPNNGIDEDCDGKDGGYIFESNSSDKDLNDLIAKAVAVLSGIVGSISVAVMVYGGIIFATAAGNDEKIRRAKKTMFGAIIGLIISLSAYMIVDFVIEKFMS